ncbi:hypothetical protein IB277_22130 [Ensifer sp. ENS07]|uniref:hypothetical protein n=1 Tax=Ensifer sp. ENS07 TaxID=2769274 RepID=UPI001786E379|nr:hypothetical protein [Ensifer sp. ENS07]MBD9638988.1 hypothetical protein [Ensifer sp. ENS07]
MRGAVRFEIAMIVGIILGGNANASVLVDFVRSETFHDPDFRRLGARNRLMSEFRTYFEKLEDVT